MIRASSKFPTRTEFVSFRARAKQQTTSHLRLLHENHTPSRLSVIVPVKVNKRAVVRNKLKRLVYDNLWERIKPQNLDVVVIFKPLKLIGKADLATIKHELGDLHV